MTPEQLKALPVGSLVKIKIDEHWEVGEILKTGPQEVTVIWPESGVKQYIGFTSSWLSFIEWLEVEEC